MSQTMWCEYCRKSGHASNKCWSTHAVSHLTPLAEMAGSSWLSAKQTIMGMHVRAALNQMTLEKRPA